MQLPCHGNSARHAPISGIGIEAGFPARHVAPKLFDYLAHAAATGTTGTTGNLSYFFLNVSRLGHAGRKKNPPASAGKKLSLEETTSL
jgi:hypothetical protein